MNRNYNSTIPAYLSPDGSPSEVGEQYLLPGGTSTLNPNYNYAVAMASSTGRVGSPAWSHEPWPRVLDRQRPV